MAWLLFPASPAWAAGTWQWSPPTGIDSSANIRGVSCPTATECIAVDEAGGEVTFNPASPASATRATIDTGSYPSLNGASCPSASQCTTVDAGGFEITFNPTSPGNPVPIQRLSGVPVDIACPTTQQCTAVQWVQVPLFSSQAITFTPMVASSPTTTVSILATATGITCPTAGQCTAFTGVYREGYEATFDPTSAGSATPVTIDSGNDIAGVSCPAATQCTLGDTAGQELTFNPTAPGTPSTAQSGETGGATACPTVTLCVAVGLNEAHNATEGNPQSATPWTVQPLEVAAGFVECPSATECVAVSSSSSSESTGTLTSGSGGGTSGPGSGPGDGGPTGGSVRATARVLSTHGTNVRTLLACLGPAHSTCKLKLTLSARELTRSGKLIAVTAGRKTVRARTIKVSIGRRSVSLPAGAHKVVAVGLDGGGRRVLKKLRRIRVAVTVTMTAGGHVTTITRHVVRFYRA